MTAIEICGRAPDQVRLQLPKPVTTVELMAAPMPMMSTSSTCACSPSAHLSQFDEAGSERGATPGVKQIWRA
ncbi:hypothetical protein [Spirosoma utsteinense]|uniref:Uncharacterized protein n=1 Tax=Spirosoma utsteinense TaxID=2585773 RepID=A0ABR6W835_9BACT|nr:hypothetical protein [Spirosoma utsteinense]MBC3784168.1 hypothetical protein [Spirosoma utsteinense]MBC3792743.1 hypothetical protein [Spirosoma utsteinense]